MQTNNKMREALSDTIGLLESILEAFSKGTGGVYMSDVVESIVNARDTLATPLRNCDKYATEAEARKAFIVWYNETWDLRGSKDAIDYCDLKHNVKDILHDYIDWLFATEEGGNDGR